ncbi:MAG: YlxM family DNA-binding protein [Lachnospiraceae bacterium]|nr:YlxM family DNA-binding protein [Lachnospiraceae bacterium]MDE6254322.1 YlxM family DNA-binding protein [Lachnospiraceae bacterium]
MDDILRQTLLYDFYGELLTEHQKQIYEDYVLNDLSLGEIAQAAGISRQGVHDLVKRCDKVLNGYEQKLHLMEKFLKNKDAVQHINRLLKEYRRTGDECLIDRIESISNQILEEM